MKYSHVISLGFYCSVALEIERQGFRDHSYPFDWCISKDWLGVENAILSYFEDYLAYDKLAQSEDDANNYKNAYNIQFFHDFTKYKTLEKQLEPIQRKYANRIKRFYTSIKEPTLFIRYINDENGKEEIEYWEENIYNLQSFLQTFNIANKIVFIANSELVRNYNNIMVYYVDKDKDSTVAKEPLGVNKSIQELFREIDYDDEVRNRNLLFFKKKLLDKMKKQKQEENILYRIGEKIYSIIMPVRYHRKKY